LLITHSNCVRSLRADAIYGQRHREQWLNKIAEDGVRRLR
jgi:hypothetical protein